MGSILPSWEYIAGFVDGEGTITIIYETKPRGIIFRPKIYVTNKSYEVLETIGKRIPFEQIVVHKGNISISKGHTWRAFASGYKILRPLEMLEPHLILKKQIARKVMEYLKLRKRHPHTKYTEEEKQMAEEVRRLVRKG